MDGDAGGAAPSNRFPVTPNPSIASGQRRRRASTMGKVEKVVVLSVLFLIASILVISITVEDPLDTSRVVQAGGGRTPADVGGAPALSQAGTPRSEPGLLSATVTPPASSQASAEVGAQQVGAKQGGAGGSAPAPGSGSGPGAAAQAGPAIPPGSALVTSAGLEPSALDDLMIHTWREGDSWRLLAHTYYGDWQRLDTLKMANEGRIPSPGDRVFVPVYLGQAASASQPATEAPRAPATARPAAAASGRVHVVKAGESLWKIAKLELGDGNRWKEIAKANEKLLKGNPDAVKVGMELRIP